MALKIEYLDKNELKPYANNAKIHNSEQVEQIKKSIEQFGFNDPIAIWHENEVVEGHGRLLAVMEMPEIEKVPIIRLDDLTDEQRKAYMLVHNKLTMNTGFDFGTLELELESIINFDMQEFGFDISVDEEPAEIVEDEIPEEVEKRCKLGDVWQLGNHRLICGDSTDVNVIDRLMMGVKADMFLTDPPYNVDYTGATKEALKILNDKMDNDSFRQFLRDAFACADSAMRAGAVFYIWHSDTEGYNFRGACADNNWKVRECLIWNKNSMVLGRQDYQWKHEPCLYGWKDGASHLWASDRKQTTVLDFNRPNRNGEHPTMKPVELFAYQISNNTHENDNILDTFGGSGTALIASEQLNRKCYMCELDPHYCDVIIQRWENFTGRKAELLNV